MNHEPPRTTPSTPPATLRTRRTPSRNLGSDVNGERSDSASHDLPSALNRPSSTRAASPIPSKHPSRVNSAIHDSSKPPGTARVSSSRPNRDSPRVSSNSSAGFWEAPWSSIQGLASQFLSGSDASGETLMPRPPNNRKRRPLAATYDGPASASPAQWGPSVIGHQEVGKGSQEDRLAQIQARKREDLLAANGHFMPDSLGKFKRRDSEERESGSVPPSEAEERDMLVYLHRVKPQDTLAGVMIKYNCQANAFRKANRLWPNDRIQIRKVVMLPVDACGVKGRKLQDAEPSPDLLTEDPNEDFMGTPTNSSYPPWTTPRPKTQSYNPERSLPSTPSSPSISVTGPDGSSPEPPWQHDSWVQIDGFVSAVEIARLPRRTLGFFPRSRRKSNSYSDIGSPPSSSLDIPRLSTSSQSQRVTTSPRRPNRSRSSSHTNHLIPSLRGPGGVGTLSGKDVRAPGPAQDGLNRLFAKHLPDVAPRESFESARSNNSSSTGLENVGGKIEGWVRRIVHKGVKGVAAAGVSSREQSRTRKGDVIELSTDAFEIGGGDGDGERRGLHDDGDEAESAVAMEEQLRERFPPRGRVFEESSRRR
ncbi:MAG: hypothetical protein LQ352_000831 [Teloschistes flavicans]|nr:MAG: hypothetical protein LQ352_000831 [Teloschistes flavicans]